MYMYKFVHNCVSFNICRVACILTFGWLNILHANYLYDGKAVILQFKIRGVQTTIDLTS